MSKKQGRYRVFTRTWWRFNSEWPSGREPHLGRKYTIGWADTAEEARAIGQRYNDTHKPGPLSRKAEYEDTREERQQRWDGEDW